LRLVQATFLWLMTGLSEQEQMYRVWNDPNLDASTINML
jgi:hypothetical protein